MSPRQNDTECDETGQGHAAAIEPPTTTAELVDRAHALCGHTLGEVAGARLGRHGDARNLLRCKGLVGNVIEGILGASSGNRDDPDFPALGVELKTLPVSPTGTVQEVTFVCRVSFARVADERWENSRVRRKLRRVLFVPVETSKEIPLCHRRIGRACLFLLEGVYERQIRSDWEFLSGRLATGDADQLTSSAGVALHLRPKAKDSRVRALAPAEDGGSILANPKGFYLRNQFTSQVLANEGLMATTLPEG